MRICIIGDSHSLFCFCEVAEASIFWLGPISMHRIGRDGLESVLPRNCRLNDFNAVILAFGEIDCRAHVPKIAERKSTSVDVVVDDLADRYIAAVVQAHKSFQGLAAICCVIPPAAHTLPLEPGETLDEVRERQLYIRRRLNLRLGILAKQYSLRFIDFYDAYANGQGELEPALSDGGLHIDPKQTKPIVAITANCLEIPLTHRPLDRDVFLIPVGNYWRRKRQLVDIWFKSRLKRMAGRA